MGTEVVHAGPIGAGTRFKLARNLMHFVAFTAAMRGAAAGRGGRARPGRARPGRPAHRRDHRRTRARSCSATPPRRWPPDDFWQPIFDHVRALGEKDLAFAIALADQLGVDVPLATQALPRLGKELGLS